MWLRNVVWPMIYWCLCWFVKRHVLSVDLLLFALICIQKWLPWLIRCAFMYFVLCDCFVVFFFVSCIFAVCDCFVVIWWCFVHFRSARLFCCNLVLLRAFLCCVIVFATFTFCAIDFHFGWLFFIASGFEWFTRACAEITRAGAEIKGACAEITGACAEITRACAEITGLVRKWRGLVRKW